MAVDGLAQICKGEAIGDRAALDVALSKGIECGGWCPAGRRAEDGAIDGKYPLTETSSREYAVRTRWNVRDSDGTLILCTGELTGGTALTREIAEGMDKPYLILAPEELNLEVLADWLVSAARPPIPLPQDGRKSEQDWTSCPHSRTRRPCPRWN